MARKTRDEALRTREAILDAAIEAFHARGVARSSLTDIAERIGMTRGAVYGHFRNKTEVLAAMLERNRYPWDTLAAAAEQATPDDPLQALAASLTGMLEHVTRDPQRLRVLTILFHRMELVGENAAMFERIHAARSEAERAIGRLLRSAVARGQLGASLDLAFAQRYLLIGLTGAMAETALEPQRWAVGVDARRIVDAWIAGLACACGRRDGRGNGDTEMATSVSPRPGEVVGLSVFVNGPGGGNPVPLVRHASGMSAAAMQAVARQHGHESAFVFDSPEPGVDWMLRFFVPNHEMEMCGHATVGTLWALRQWGEWVAPTARIRTLSGLVDVRWDEARQRVWISQPAASVATLARDLTERVQQVLDPVRQARWQGDAVNACTSRTKTLARVGTVAELDRLAPQVPQVEAVCGEADSTGLYPYAVEPRTDGAPIVAARQFPRASGYPEDAATGIAAAALWGYLITTGDVQPGTPEAPIVTTIRQGEALGRPSAIDVQPRFDVDGRPAGCWLSGQVIWSAP